MEGAEEKVLELEHLKNFHVSLTHGFLLENPTKELPRYFEPWEKIAQNMVALVQKGDVRSEIQRMPLLDTRNLEGPGLTEEEKYRNFRLAHLQLTTLMSGYVWSEGDLNLPRVLPKQIAVPLWEVCERLGAVRAGCSYMAVVLSNYQKIDDALPLRVVNPEDNLKLISFKVIPDFGNDWFLLNAAQIELDFAPCLPHLVNGIQASRSANDKGPAELKESLENLADVIRKMEGTLWKVQDFLHPDVFFNKFRPFIAGFTGGNFEEWGGLIFEGVDPLPKKFVGGSAAQSSTLQCIDAFLGVKHEGYLKEMREYMPPEHKGFIELIERQSRVRQAVQGDPELKAAYDDCIDAMENFRNRHIRIVTKFIANPKSRAQRSRSSSVSSSGVSSDSEEDGGLREVKSYESLDNIGTGGTPTIPFLKSVRDETKQAK